MRFSRSCSRLPPTDLVAVYYPLDSMTDVHFAREREPTLKAIRELQGTSRRLHADAPGRGRAPSPPGQYRADSAPDHDERARRTCDAPRRHQAGAQGAAVCQRRVRRAGDGADRPVSGGESIERRNLSNRPARNDRQQPRHNRRADDELQRRRSRHAARAGAETGGRPIVYRNDIGARFSRSSATPAPIT